MGTVRKVMITIKYKNLEKNQFKGPIKDCLIWLDHLYKQSLHNQNKL